jgi:hypothetical protein
MSASLFSSLLLYFKKQDNGRHLVGTFLPLFHSLVLAELACIGSPKIKGRRKKKRKLQFCSFDHSSVITPVDIVQGSNTFLESCIESLVDVIQKLSSLRPTVESENSLSCLRLLISTLRALESDPNNEMLVECSKVKLHFI